jgi:single-stranded DNA-binding protein
MVKGGELPLLTFSCVVDQQHQTEDVPATWIRVATFGDLAEQMAERLVKGVRVYVEGKLEASVWTPESGPPRLSLKVTANTVVPMGRIGRRRPRPTPRQNDRARDAQRPFHDDSDLAVADLQGRGR